MDEDFLDVTESSKKIGIILILIILTILIAGYFLVFKKFYFSLKTVEVELGSSVSENVEDYLNQKGASLKDYELDISKVNVNEVGEYTYTVTYNKTTKKGKVKVVDTTPPEFTVQELVIESGEDYYLGDFLASCEDLSKPCLVNLKNEKDESKFSIVGTHSIDIVVTDIYGNAGYSSVSLKVVEEGSYVDPKALDLEYYSNSKELDPFDGIVYEKLEKGLATDSEEAKDMMNIVGTVDLEAYVKANYPDYTLKSSEIIELYNKSSYIIGYSIMLTINNGKDSVVYVDKTKVPTTETEVGEE